MFLIETITVIPSRIATKLVSSWLLRSKISRHTKVRNRMEQSSYRLGPQPPGPHLPPGQQPDCAALSLSAI